MPKKAYLSGKPTQPQRATRITRTTRSAQRTAISRIKMLRNIRNARRLSLTQEESTEVQPISFGGVQVQVSNRVDKLDKSKKSRRFVFTSANKPTVTIVDNDPDSPGITGTIKVSGVTYSLNLTFDQINEAYGEVISRVTSERVENE